MGVKMAVLWGDTVSYGCDFKMFVTTEQDVAEVAAGLIPHQDHIARAASACYATRLTPCLVQTQYIL